MQCVSLGLSATGTHSPSVVIVNLITTGAGQEIIIFIKVSLKIPKLNLFFEYLTIFEKNFGKNFCLVLKPFSISKMF